MTVQKKHRALSFFLALILLVYLIPIYATAETSENGFSQEENNWSLTNVEIADDYAISSIEELVTLREEYVKHFRLENGQYQAVVYATPVHRKNSSGVWMDIDNNLSLMDYGRYSTHDGRVSFAKSFSADQSLLLLQENGYSLSMALLGSALDETMIVRENEVSVVKETDTVASLASNAVIVNAPLRNQTVFSTLEQAVKIDNKTTVSYSNVCANTDIEYVLQGNSIKENILVKAPANSYVYRFRLALTGLDAILRSDGDILLTDEETGARVYRIPAPFMYDANGQRSYSVSYALSEVANGEYELLVAADSVWINAEERAFPVTIDPTIDIDMLPYDTYMSSANPNTSYGFDENFRISPTETAFICFPWTPTLPAGSTVEWGDLYLHQYYTNSTAPVTIGIYAVTEMWDEDWTWNDLSEYTNHGIGTDLLGTMTVTPTTSMTQLQPSEVALDITLAMTAWCNGTLENNGVALKFLSGTASSSLTFVSCEADSAYTPIMTVVYNRYLDNGVYAIKNAGATTKYLMTVPNDVPALARLRYKQFSMSPVTQFYSSEDVIVRAALFKITRVDDALNSNYYVIRSMLNDCLTLSLNGTGWIMKYIPADDAQVAASDLFCIDYYDGGFTIRQNGTPFIFALAADNSMNIVRANQNTVTNSTKWLFEKYTGSHKAGIEVDMPDSFTAGETKSIEVITWATWINCNIPTVDVTTNENNDGLTSTVQSIRPYRFQLTAHDACAATIAVRLSKPNGAVAATFTYTGEVRLPIEEGIYFIKNAQLTYYLGIDAGNQLQLQGFDNKEWLKWTLCHSRDGYYSICSHNGQYIIAPQASTDSIILSSTVSADNRYLWKIEETSEGSFKILSKYNLYGIDPGCLASQNDLRGCTLSEVCLQQYTADALFDDVWIFETAQYPPDIVFCDIYDPDQEFPSVEEFSNESDATPEQIEALTNLLAIPTVTDIQNDLRESGFDDARISSEYVTASGFSFYLDQARIVVFNGHGKAYKDENDNTIFTGIQLRTLSDAESGSLDVFPVEFFSIRPTDKYTEQQLEMLYPYCVNYISPADDYSNLELAVFVGCEIGSGGENDNNLPSAVVDAGAEVAIGFANKILSPAGDAWLAGFFEYLLQGYTVEEAAFASLTAINEVERQTIQFIYGALGETAVEEALSAAERDNTLITHDSIVICGNKDYRLVDIP